MKSQDTPGTRDWNSEVPFCLFLFLFIFNSNKADFVCTFLAIFFFNFKKLIYSWLTWVLLCVGFFYISGQAASPAVAAAPPAAVPRLSAPDSQLKRSGCPAGCEL